MTTSSQNEEPFSRLLRRWISYRLSQAMGAITPAHRAHDVAAAAAASNNPAGA